jgi:hypothetical protein
VLAVRGLRKCTAADAWRARLACVWEWEWEWEWVRNWYRNKYRHVYL